MVKYIEDAILRNKNLKDKKVILGTPSKEEKINKVKKGRSNEMCNYKHNELINIKALKNQFRKSTKNY